MVIERKDGLQDGIEEYLALDPPVVIEPIHFWIARNVWNEGCSTKWVERESRCLQKRCMGNFIYRARF